MDMHRCITHYYFTHHCPILSIYLRFVVVSICTRIFFINVFQCLLIGLAHTGSWRSKMSVLPSLLLLIHIYNIDIWRILFSFGLGWLPFFPFVLTTDSSLLESLELFLLREQ